MRRNCLLGAFQAIEVTRPGQECPLRLFKFALSFFLMKRIIFMFLLLAEGYAAAAQEAAPSCPLSSSVTIDGNGDEWPMTWVQDDEKVFSFNVCADEQNLYVRMMTNDYYAKRKLAAFGLTMWFDPNGKKKKKLGLRFPVGGAEAEERASAIKKQGEAGSSVGERSDYQKLIDGALIANLEVIELIGLSDDPVTATRSGITNGIKVAIAMDASGAYVYECLIPFRSYRISGKSLTEISVGFETGKYTAPKQKTTTKQVTDNTLNTTQMSRMQGYGSLIGNPKLSYPSSAWTLLKLK